MALEFKVVSLVGVVPGVAGAIAYIDDTEIQFVCGRSICSHDIETRTQRYLAAGAGTLAVTAVGVSNNRKLVHALMA